MIYSGAILAYHQSFQWKALFTKPLRFVIQLFTGEYSHVGIYIGGEIYEMIGAGFKVSSISSWIKEHEKSRLKCYFYNLRNPLNLPEQLKAISFIEKFKIVKYGAGAAALSPIDNSALKINSKNTFCSDFVSQIYEHLEILKPRGNGSKNDPNELIDRMNDFNLLEGRERIK